MGARFLARVVALVCAGLSLASFAPPVHAQDADATQAAAPLPQVKIVVVGGDAANSAALQSRVASWFRGQGTSAETSRLQKLPADTVFAPSPEPGVRVWIVLRTLTAARLFFSVQGEAMEPPRYLVSDVELNGGLDELGMEQLAQVAYLSAVALWAGNAESTRKEVEERLRLTYAEQRKRVAKPARKAPPPEPARAAGVAIKLGLEYAARFQGEEGLAHGPGATIGVVSPHSKFELGGRVHGALFLPHHVEKSGVELEIHGASFGLGLTLAERVSERICLTGEFGPGLDVVRYSTVSVADGSLRPSNGDVDVRPLVFATFGARADFGAVSVGVAALLAVQLLRTHYDVSDPNGRTELLVPWVAQPGVTAGFFW